MKTIRQSIKKTMENISIRRAALSGVGLSLAAIMSVSAQANTRSYADMSAVKASSLSVSSQSANERNIILPYGKSTVIELPQGIQDVIVSNPDVVEAVVHTSTRTVLIGKQAGQTNAYFYGQNDQELLNLNIRVERDISELNQLIRKNASDAEVEVQAIHNNILLTGSVQNAASADRIEKLAKLWLNEIATGTYEPGEVVNLMSIEGRDQVMLKVRIVEMQRSVTKQLGFNIGAVAQLGESTVSLVSNAGLGAMAGLSGEATVRPAGGDITSLTGAIQALERVGLIRTLAEPSLTAISGETANTLIGGEFPLLTNVFLDEFGRTQREFEFKPYGVSLGFTPVVLSEGLISLNISTEVSEPTTEGSFETGGISSDILGLRVRRANTVVEMPAGGSLVIAGLIREESRSSSDGTPGAKDIPGLGALFRNSDSTNTQTELVVIVTPYLVDATHPDKLQTPLDGYVPPSDGESILLGRLNKVYSEDGQPRISQPALGGPFGHVVD
ncbi:type II and III secretion system protein family protein [Litorimonas sp.]|jgi:pilus assembly protein CpaC|uniref:type II and III secretion system protein family protein n=1 Tax=Litorimonas sp. TaxID=1892381 RepID=UPI003A8962BA